ncbi:MAG TPA: ABC transporter ATP-binding protein, partial [Xanthobacteraceae bacterium]
VRDINASGTSVLLVEQNVRQAMRIATYGYVMERGSIAAEGAADRLLHSDVIRQSYLGKI